MDVAGFKALAAKVMAEPDLELSMEEVEKLFWRKIGAWTREAGVFVLVCFGVRRK